MGTPDPERLRALALFADLTPDDCQRIASWSYQEEFLPGRTIAAEGRARTTRSSSSSTGPPRCRTDARAIRTLGPGDHFGEKAILEGGVRTATVTADNQPHG